MRPGASNLASRIAFEHIDFTLNPVLKPLRLLATNSWVYSITSPNFASDKTDQRVVGAHERIAKYYQLFSYLPQDFFFLPPIMSPKFFEVQYFFCSQINSLSPFWLIP